MFIALLFFAFLVLAISAMVAFGVQQKEVAFREALKKFELEAFNTQLLEAIANGERPATDSGMTRLMVNILFEFENLPPDSKETPVVAPLWPDEKKACEELVMLHRLTRLPDDKGYASFKRG